jgi:hypothetical protein
MIRKPRILIQFLVINKQDFMIDHVDETGILRNSDKRNTKPVIPKHFIIVEKFSRYATDINIVVKSDVHFLFSLGS